MTEFLQFGRLLRLAGHTWTTMTILAPEAQSKIRQAAASTLEKLANECGASDHTVQSWLAPTTMDEPATSPSDSYIYFHTAGFLHLPAFCDSETTCRSMKEEMAQMIIDDWNPENVESFGTSAQDNEARGDYFLESADKVHYFAEPHALNGTALKKEYCSDAKKIRALNKVGHGLHLLEQSTFSSYCFSEKILATVTDLGWKDPVVPQSMYILKQAETGGVVHSHQDRYVRCTSMLCMDQFHSTHLTHCAPC